MVSPHADTAPQPQDATQGQQEQNSGGLTGQPKSQRWAPPTRKAKEGALVKLPLFWIVLGPSGKEKQTRSQHAPSTGRLPKPQNHSPQTPLLPLQMFPPALESPPRRRTWLNMPQRLQDRPCQGTSDSEHPLSSSLLDPRSRVTALAPLTGSHRSSSLCFWEVLSPAEGRATKADPGHLQVCLILTLPLWTSDLRQGSIPCTCFLFYPGQAW